MANEPAVRPKRPFQPWKKNLLNGFAAMCILFLIYATNSIFQIQLEKVIALCAVVSLYAAWQFKQASVRSYGQRLEKKSIKKLISVIGSENVRGNVVLPGRGDIDCVIKIKDEIFNIEIKAFREIKKINRAHIKQTLDAAKYLKSIPVIWLPNFKDTQFSERNGVLMCACDAKRLVRKLA